MRHPFRQSCALRAHRQAGRPGASPLVRWFFLRLFALLLLLFGGAGVAQAGTQFCSSYPLVGGFHVIDGNDPSLNTLTLPSSIGMDANCYFKNFQVSAKWPQGLTSTLNFKSDGFLAIFENTYFSGNMACANTTTKIWFVNNAQYAPNNSCQSLFIPVETISKQVPGPTATVGVPFTYTLRMPVMYDPATNTYYSQPSVNTLSNATIYDDLTATGAALTYVSNTAFLVNGATRTPVGPLTLGATPATMASMGIPASDSTKHIVFSSDFNPVLSNIAAGTQVEIQMTVVLDNVPANASGTQFINTAKWWFGRVIDGVAYDPLPGQSGISAPMTIAEPGLTLQKTASLTNLNIGTAAPYRLNVQNVGGSDAWNTTITDLLPSGMCAFDPTPTVSARIYAADGVTPVSPVLTPGTDYLVSYSACQLSVVLLSEAAKIAPTQRLIIGYQSRLDAGTAPGVSFTNVAGATRWYNGPLSSTGRRQYDRTLSNGTPGILDFQDAYTVTSTTQGYFLLKSVSNLTTGVPVATAAFPGDRLRYTLQIQNFTFPTLSNITVVDELDALNASASFVPGSLALASSNLPAGTTLSVNPTGGPRGTGSVTISGLNLLQDQQYQVEFDITMASGLGNGTVVLNQASLTGTDANAVVWSGVSDDPYISGPALLSANGDPTPVQIFSPGALAKATTQSTAAIGELFRYRITVPASPVNVPLYDVRILDNLGLSAADLRFVSATVVSGGNWSLSNTGSATNLVIQDSNTGIDIPAGGQAVIDVTVALQNSAVNRNGLSFTNSASYTYNKINGNNATTGNGGGATSGAMTVVEPALGMSKAVAYVMPAGKAVTDPAVAGDVLQYTITLTNTGTSPAYDVDVIDAMPANLALVPASASVTINGVAVAGFEPEPTVLAGGALVWGAQNGDSNLDIPVGGTLVLTFRATVQAANGTPITNSVHAAWASVNGGVIGERNGAGCPFVTAPNVYCVGPAISTVTSVDPTTLTKTVSSDSWATAPSTASDATLRVGDTVVYTLTATLREGTTQNLVLRDTLPAGMAFDGVLAINGDTSTPYTQVAPFTHASLAGPTLSGNTVTWNFGTVSNAVDNNAANNAFVIQYRARVVNTLAATPPAQLLTNSATLNYAIGGVAATPRSASVPINVWQPVLGVSKSAAPAGGSTVIAAGELVSYTIEIQNTGPAPAYNTVLQDVLPVGMRATAPLTLSVSLVNAGTTLPSLAPVYNSSTGLATWNFSSGVAGQYAIPPSETLRLVYQARADATIGAGMILTNQARVQHYYSLDSLDANAAARKDYGATGTATVQLTTASATALAKQALVSTAAIGQPFTYRITIPAVPQPTSLYDVRVLDDIGLATTGVSLTYLGASARLASNTRSWASLSNSGTATALTLQDSSSGGLDIPAGDQLIVDVVLVLGNDIVNNSAGKQFSNTATYTYNRINSDSSTQAAGSPGASGPVTVAAPNLVMRKSGPATMRIDQPGSFTLDVQNAGTAPAWNVVLSDILPRVTGTPAGGMCNAAPSAITARIYQADGVTPVSALLQAGTDYTVGFTAAPGCTLTLNLLTPAAAIGPGERLIVTYSAMLDPATANSMPLTNIAGATRWLSANPAVTGASGHVHTFSNTLTNGTPGVTDFQDAFT
ncbi:MAG: isopeptide-forming domain-containing fimbrial protein, partial [Curvibacter sp.]